MIKKQSKPTIISIEICTSSTLCGSFSTKFRLLYSISIDNNFKNKLLFLLHVIISILFQNNCT